MGNLIYLALILCAALNYVTNTILARQLLKTENERIVGGKEVNIKDFPYMAYLMLFNGSAYLQCGGSIISTHYVLTAAHCLRGIQKVVVRIGSNNSDSGGKTYESSVLSSHPLYDPVTFDYDVAVIKVFEKMHLDGTYSTKLRLIRGGKVIPQDTMVNITGWGALTEGGSRSGHLMGISVPTLSNPHCQSLYSEDVVTERMPCAGLREGGKDACQGDSGGPAVTRGRQVGIVSNGFGCARPNEPGIYTNVTNIQIRKWITKSTGV